MRAYYVYFIEGSSVVNRASVKLREPYTANPPPLLLSDTMCLENVYANTSLIKRCKYTSFYHISI